MSSCSPGRRRYASRLASDIPLAQNAGMSAISTLTSKDHVRGGKLAIAGGALTVLGVFLSWITVTADDFSQTTENGMVGGGGAIILGVGIFVVALGLWVILGHPRTAWVLLAVAGVAVVGLTSLEYFSEIKERVQSTFGFSTASVGTGIYTLFAGGLATALAGMMLGGEIRRAPTNMVLAFLTGLAIVVFLATLVVIAFLSPVRGPAT
jgi:hypothetical protein